MRRIDRIVATGAALLAAWLVLHFRLLEPHTGPLDARVLAVVDAVRRRSGSDAVNEARGRVAHALIQAPTSRWPRPSSTNRRSCPRTPSSRWAATRCTAWAWVSGTSATLGTRRMSCRRWAA
jgi:hypothetical protein